MESIGFIYKTTCLVNGKIYIGRHEGSENDNYLGSGILFTNALKKYGRDNFKREILRRCHCQHELEIWEYFYIKVLKSQNPKIGYNIADGDVNSKKGNPAHRPEVRKKISEKTKRRMANPENNPMYDKHHSKEACEKIRKSRIGVKWTEEQKQRMSKQRKGKKLKPLSEEAKRKISEKTKRRMANPENNPMYGNHRFAGKNNPMYGKHHSEETRKKISESMMGRGKGRLISEETRKKMSEAQKLRFQSDERKNKLSGENNPFYGKRHSESLKNKLSELRKGEGNPFYGKYHTEETKRKISEANKKRCE